MRPCVGQASKHCLENREFLIRADCGYHDSDVSMSVTWWVLERDGSNTTSDPSVNHEPVVAKQAAKSEIVGLISAWNTYKIVRNVMR